MTAVLRVIDAAEGEGLRRAAAQSGDVSAGEQLTLNLGPPSLAGGVLASARAALLIRQRLRAASASVIHAFGHRALIPALLAGARRSGASVISAGPPASRHSAPRVPVVVTVDEDAVSARAHGWLRAAHAASPISVICPSESVRRVLLRRGVDASRTRLVRPGVDLGSPVSRRDRALRARLGIAETDRVVLAAGVSTAAANHPLAVWAVAILHALDPRYRCLVWGRGAGLARVRAMASGQSAVSDRAVLIEAPDCPWDYALAAADVLLATPDPGPALGPDGTQTWALLSAMAAGVPIVATTTQGTAEVLEDRFNALLVTSPTAVDIARRILKLHAEPSLEWGIADRARAQAYEKWGKSASARALREVYSSLAGPA